MTAQIMDTLNHDGQLLHVILSFGLPDDCPSIAKLDAVPKETPSIVRSTACSRGYVGHWIVNDGGLYLESLEGAFRKECDGLIEAVWVTGDFTIVRTGSSRSEYAPYLPQFKTFARMSIEDGKITSFEVT